MKVPKEVGRNCVCSSPEVWGLEVVDQIEYSTGSYEFDTRIVWKDEDGRLWSGRDSGCSCPCPFEGFVSEANFERVTKEWIEKVLEPELEYERRYRISFEDANNFRSKVWDAYNSTVACA